MSERQCNAMHEHGQCGLMSGHEQAHVFPPDPVPAKAALLDAVMHEDPLVHVDRNEFDKLLVQRELDRNRIVALEAKLERLGQ